METDPSTLDRAHGALMGLAVGDTLGMPSQTLTVEEIGRHYGRITGFVAPFEDHPVSHGLRAGQVTDDTEQALIVAQRLVEGRGRIDAGQLAHDLLDWEAGIKARGLRDLLGPSTKAALEAMVAGAPVTETGRKGTTNGAAMRIAPVGIACSIGPVPEFVDRVEAACRLTHNTGEAIAGAAGVAAVISCGVQGLAFEAALPIALNAVREGQTRGHPVGEAHMAARIEAALKIVRHGGRASDLADRIGTSVASSESVAAAFGLVRLAGGDPWLAGVMAANIGDDTDTIGAIAGAMAGACTGLAAIPDHAVETIEAVNRLDLRDRAKALLGLREISQTETAPEKTRP